MGNGFTELEAEVETEQRTPVMRGTQDIVGSSHIGKPPPTRDTKSFHVVLNNINHTRFKEGVVKFERVSRPGLAISNKHFQPFFFDKSL